MKKMGLLCGLACFISETSFPQKSFEFVPFSGYTFHYKMIFTQRTGVIDGNMNFGASLMFNKTRRFAGELFYSHLQTPARLYKSDPIPGDQPLYQTSAGINYIMAGLITSFPLHHSPVNPRLNFFFGCDLGVSLTTPSPNIISGSNINFAMSLQTGVNYYISPGFGIRISARMTGSPISLSEYYFGEWGGSRGFLAILSPGIFLGSLHVGISIGLGKEMPGFQKRLIKPRKQRHSPFEGKTKKSALMRKPRE